MSERKRPKYTKEFKQDAIKLVIEQRYSCPEVGGGVKPALGINRQPYLILLIPIFLWLHQG